MTILKKLRKSTFYYEHLGKPSFKARLLTRPGSSQVSERRIAQSLVITESTAKLPTL